MSGPCIYCTLDTSGRESVEHPIPEALGGSFALPRDYCCLGCNSYVKELDQCVASHPHLAAMIVLGVIRGKASRVRRTIQDGARFDPETSHLDINAVKGEVSLNDEHLRVQMHDDRSFDPRKFSRGVHKIAYALACHQQGRDAMLSSILDPLRDYLRRPQRREFWPYMQRIRYTTLTLSALQRLASDERYRFAIARDDATGDYLCYVSLLVDEFVVSLGPGLEKDTIAAIEFGRSAACSNASSASENPWRLHLEPKESTILA